MKKVLCGVIIFLFISSLASNVFATDGNIWQQATEWINLGRNEQSNSPYTSTGGFENLAGILTGLGIWIIVISGAILGIRFMISEPEKKAELKKSLMIYAIGSVIILGALGIWRLVFSILDIF